MSRVKFARSAALCGLRGYWPAGPQEVDLYLEEKAEAGPERQRTRGFHPKCVFDAGRFILTGNKIAGGTGPHSSRRTTAGSTRVARRAGDQHPAAAATTSTAQTDAYTRTSAGLTA